MDVFFLNSSNINDNQNTLPSHLFWISRGACFIYCLCYFPLFNLLIHTSFKFLFEIAILWFYMKSKLMVQQPVLGSINKLFHFQAELRKM